jgi:hypothetical protein
MKKYVTFGSPTSQDCDLMVFVDHLGSIQENKKTVLELQHELQYYFNKRVNVNIGVLSEGKLEQVFKGTLDEVNNSIFDTYKFHIQHIECPINERMNRDVNEKILRSVRIILSNISRTDFRDKVKNALLLDFWDRVSCLEDINFDDIKTHEKYDLKDVFKTLAFQMGQTQALINNIELYTKEGVIEHFPQLSPYIKRENCDGFELTKFKKEFIQTIKNNKQLISKTKEQLIDN